MPTLLERSAQIASSSAKRFWTWTALLSHRVSYNSHRKIFQTVKGPKYRSHNRSPKKKNKFTQQKPIYLWSGIKNQLGNVFLCGATLPYQ